MCQYSQAIVQCASRNIDPQALANEQRAQAARHGASRTVQTRESA